VVLGVTETGLLGDPAPAPLMALTRKNICVPFAKFVALKVVNDEPVLAITVVQVVPSTEFSIL
jgi:hypothetical protein